MAGMIKYLQSFRFKGLTVILGVFLAISVVLWTERSGIQYQAEIKKNAYLDRDTVVTETQAVKNIESSCLVLMDSSQADSVVAWEQFERIFMDMKTGVDLADIRQSEIPSGADVGSEPIEGCSYKDWKLGRKRRTCSFCVNTSEGYICFAH